MSLTRGRSIAPSWSAATSEEVTLGLGRRQRRGPLVLGRRLLGPPESLQQVRPRGVERLIALELERFDQLECGCRPLELADGDRAIESDDARRDELEQLVVERHDLRPVG